MMPNDDEKRDVFDIVPRLGAFEISTVFTSAANRATDILIFSKILSHLWPHEKTVTNKLDKYLEELRSNAGPSFGIAVVNIENLKGKY